jgi:heat-inducible transcriptional repressor
MGYPGQIGQREREILTAIVETYIATGEPVGSRTLSRANSESLSAASIRNVMADLVDSGYLQQPHTSAGRIPTPAAFRFYVDQITGRAELSPADTNLIQQTLRGAGDVEEFMERTSHVLSLVSRGMAIAVAGSGQKNALEHLYFSRLGDKKVLAVVVTKSGLVRDRLLRVDRDIPQSDLDVASRYINDNFRGWTMDSLRAEIGRQIERERSEYDHMMTSIAELYRKGALAGDTANTVFMEGAANLISNDQDATRLRDILRALEEKERVVELLNAYIGTHEEAIRVVIGLEQGPADLKNFVLIGAPARVGNEVVGSLAVIGPTRMDYQHTITAVSYIARLFDSILNENETQG